ncbi:extracellular solute-binding protein [Bradyrhizobium sp. sBnM-33]|uniref:extracellular solute-binding protein n=1 Tax=Bradyrhizobium sp. sBnM-33 TaxID=2831780 RepID=UPI001BCED265|nr:extracellular solute-binding protein [Bradyrhizobium sp. sBnM-33]WOH52587.1 extracellular solute-binding protein [Bradyrhizobium sp. sBnM-33]
MNSFKRMICSIAFTAALLGANAAFSETLEIAAGSDNTKLLEAIGAAFEAANPGVKVNVPPGPRSYDDLAQDLLRRQTVGQVLPDLLVVGSNQRLYADRGLAVPLDPLLAANPDLELAKASPIVREKGRVGEAIFGAALGVSAPVVMFNSELVRKAGGDPNALPEDWDGILSLAKQIDRLGPPVVGGFIEADTSGAFTFLFLLQSQGGSVMDKAETKLQIDTPEGLRALTVLKRFGEAGQAKAAMTRDQARQAFGAGTIGILVGTSSTITVAEKAAGNRFTVVAMPLPVKPGVGTVPTSGPVASILKTTPAKQKLALKFIDFALGPKGQQIVAESSGYYPANQRAIDASHELKARIANRPNAQAVFANFAVATGWYTPPGAQAARIPTIVNNHLLQVVTLKEAPEDAAKALTKEIEPLVRGTN